MKTAFITIFLMIVCALNACSGSDETGSADESVDANAVPAVELTDADAALREGTRLLETGETDMAIEVLGQAVAMNPDLADAYFQLGIAYALVETRDQATEIVAEEPTPTPKEEKPKEVKTNSEIAFEKAVAAYKKMLKANPDDAAANFNLGRAYNKLNEDEDAAEALREAVKLKPDDTEYQTELGAILIKLAKYHEAIAPLRKALELDPANSKAQQLLDDAEAGRKRITFTTAKKDANSSRQSGDDSNSNTKAGSNSGKPAKTVANTKPIPTQVTKPN